MYDFDVYPDHLEVHIFLTSERRYLGRVWLDGDAIHEEKAVNVMWMPVMDAVEKIRKAKHDGYSKQPNSQ
jgi:hypothetical protein